MQDHRCRNGDTDHAEQFLGAARDLPEFFEKSSPKITEASPRGPNQPTKIFVCHLVPVPISASQTGSMRPTVRISAAELSTRHETSSKTRITRTLPKTKKAPSASSCAASTVNSPNSAACALSWSGALSADSVWDRSSPNDPNARPATNAAMNEFASNAAAEKSARLFVTGGRTR